MIVLTRGAAALLTLGLSAAVVTGCGTSKAAAPSTADLAKRYLAIATPANHVLDESFDALDDHDDDISASATVLQTIATTERGFDRDLLAMKLPGQMASVAAALVRVNEARAALTLQAVTATSVASLKRYETQLDAMNPPVETQVTVLRKDLGLPPPDTD